MPQRQHLVRRVVFQLEETGWQIRKSGKSWCAVLVAPTSCPCRLKSTPAIKIKEKNRRYYCLYSPQYACRWHLVRRQLGMFNTLPELISSSGWLISFSSSSVTRWTRKPDTPCRLPVQLQTVPLALFLSLCDVHEKGFAQFALIKVPTGIWHST